jgi:hypothetical protein
MSTDETGARNENLSQEMFMSQRKELIRYLLQVTEEDFCQVLCRLDHFSNGALQQYMDEALQLDSI